MGKQNNKLNFAKGYKFQLDNASRVCKGLTFPPIVSAAGKEQCPALHLRQLIL